MSHTVWFHLHGTFEKTVSLSRKTDQGLPGVGVSWPCDYKGIAERVFGNDKTILYFICRWICMCAKINRTVCKKKVKFGFLLWFSRLRIWCCHCSGSGHCRGANLIPGLGTFTCHRCSPKKKKKKKKKRMLIYFFMLKFYFK